MAYKALYRTYRPQLFREVVGQEAIVKTLQNAIINKKISHAYLFSGPRGTGKTTIARIFAKVLNCENPDLTEPCNTCDSCHEISDSISPDVIEIDAASNNGVDEIRDIREKVKFLPSGAKYKIYIIDEVHMLSTGAFNALLKTLEEPPKHVIFILATTEPQKLPSTIISRCQRFDFKSLSISEINKRLRKVCAEEDVTVTEEAFNAVSEAAEGALRDALSILDQAISYSNETVTIEDVNSVTGNLSNDKIIELAQHIFNHDINKTLEMITELVSSGKEISKLVASILTFYRDVLLYQNVDSVLYSKYIFEKETFQGLAKMLEPTKVFYYIDVLTDLQNKIKFSTTPQIYLEVALIKMVNVSNDELDYSRRIEEIETKIANINTTSSSTISSGEISEEDKEKIDGIDARLNRVITELNKLELHKLKEQVEKGLTSSSQEIKVDNTEVENKITELKETIDLIKTNYQELKEEIDNYPIENNSDKDEYNVDEEINLLTQSVRSLKDDINSLKVEITAVNNKKFEVTEINTNNEELVNKVNTLEKRILQIISGETSLKTTKFPKEKKPAGQIVLFGDDIAPISEIKRNEEKLIDTKITEETNSVEKEIKETNTIETPINQLTESIDVEEDNSDFTEAKDEDFEEDNEKDDIKNEVVQEVVNPQEKKVNEEITRVYDSETKTEYINKVNSQIVIKPRTESIFNDEKELIEKEMESIKPKTFEKQETLSVKPERVAPSVSFATYDHLLIEKIMNDSRTNEAIEDKNRILQLWKRMSERVEPMKLSTTEILQEGKIAVVGLKMFVLVYSSSATCNHIMSKKFKMEASKILYHFLGSEYDYIALPEKVWYQKRKEYVDQYNIGIKYPKLTPINDPELVIRELKDEYKSANEKTIDDAIALFGSDFVKIE